MKLTTKKELLENYDNKSYVWYACYGSNINFERFKLYIEGDKKGKLSTYNGCKDKTLPIGYRKYIIKHPIYFASHSIKWNGGVAFLDYENKGKCYGRMYKITLDQFIDVFNQEHIMKFYNAILLLGIIDDTPILTFTAKHKLEETKPSVKYIHTIRNGIMETYHEEKEMVSEYLKEHITE